ncbi:MAG: M42 family metallopeptidase [Caldilineaceae bacterium]|nr:M42 family metallopeptidase [Caldilineaceae bacterium]HRJ40325.1 M42 family metallopeptidase [Caldilineaceae bacterium]
MTTTPLPATFDLLKELTELPGIAGYEEAIRARLVELLTPLTDEVRTDALGNVIALKRGTGGAGQRLMLAAHMDEIGLVVTKLDRGFLRFTRIGGINERVLPSQEVIVHGKRDLPGIIASRPPHVLSADNRKENIPSNELFVDVGLLPDELAQAVSVGDLISIRRETIQLGKDKATGKAFDNRACLTALILALHQLQKVRHTWDIYAVATVQEEIGLRGATTSTFGVAPDVGIALDVTFAVQPGANGDETLAWDKGAAIGLGPNIHPKIHEKLVETAKASEIPYVVEVLAGNSGTDAWAMQVTQAGIPTGLLSIPVRNMHTPGETLVLTDIERTARLLAAFAAGLDGETLDGLRLE